MPAVHVAADVAGEAALQLTGVVDAIGDDGGIGLRCLDEIAATRLESGILVTLEYFLGGTVFRLIAPVVLVGPGTTEDGPASHPRLVLDAPSDVERIQRHRYKRALVGVPVTLARSRAAGLTMMSMSSILTRHKASIRQEQTGYG